MRAETIIVLLQRGHKLRRKSWKKDLLYARISKEGDLEVRVHLPTRESMGETSGYEFWHNISFLELYQKGWYKIK
jgi:hypothetical protein